MEFCLTEVILCWEHRWMNNSGNIADWIYLIGPGPTFDLFITVGCLTGIYCAPISLLPLFPLTRIQHQCSAGAGLLNLYKNRFTLYSICELNHHAIRCRNTWHKNTSTERCNHIWIDYSDWADVQRFTGNLVETKAVCLVVWSHMSGAFVLSCVWAVI